MLTLRGPAARFVAGVLFVATLGGAVGCRTLNGPCGVPTLTVTPDRVTLAATQTQLFVATYRNAAGNIVTSPTTWTVVAGGGSINSAGLFTAGATAGTYTNTVRATSGGISATATVTVTPAAGPLATITVTPNPVTMAVNSSQQFVAVGKDAQGVVVPITPTWTVVAGGGTINSAGMFTAGAAGGTFTNTVRASSGSISGTATVIVTTTPGALASITVTPNPATLAPNSTQQFVAVGKDAQGVVLAITPTWSVVAGGGSINSAGLFTAGAAAGTFANTVRAASGSISGTATVIVTPLPGTLATITVTPNPATLAPNGTQQFIAVGKDAQGLVVAITPTWSVVAGGGSINSLGLFTAGAAAGTFANTVRAASGSISGTATVIVTPSPGTLATITVTPNPDTLAANTTQLFVAIGKDAQGLVVPITPTWSVVAGGGSISSLGLFTAGAVGGTFTNTVRAASGSISGNATVVVTTLPGSPSLGSAAAFGSLSGVTLTNTGPTHIEGDIGVSPGSSVTGFPPGTVTGTIHLGDAVATQAQVDLTTAYNSVAGAVCNHDLSTQDLGARTLTPGVYCFASSAQMTGTLTLDGQGDANAVFMFQIASALTTAPNAAVLLINGAQARNVWWQVGSSATLGTGTAFKGNVLAFSSVTLTTGASLVGRAFARNAAVSFDTNMVTLP